MEKHTDSSRNDYIVLALFVALTVIMFAWELALPVSEKTQREEILFKAFELLFSSAVGWSLQRIQSRDEFRKSLRQFAISAYRRILDIEKAVTRLSSTITRFEQDANAKAVDFRNLIALTDGIIDTVNSSAADWQDILGEDLKKIELYKSLKEDYARSSTQGTSNAELESLKQQIEKLRSEIPSQLVDVKPISEYRTPDEVVRYIFDALEEAGEYTILAKIYDTISPEAYLSISQLPIGSPLVLEFGQSMHSSGFNVLLGEDNLIGKLINPFESFGIHEFEFHNALANVLRVSVPNEHDKFEASFGDITRNDRNIFRVRIKALLEPYSRAEE